MIAVAIAVGIAVPLAIAVRRHRILRASTIGITGVLYTIPSIALFGMLVPLMGLGARPVVVGLVLYSLLVIIRNTLVGLSSVPASVRDVGVGMGFTPSQLLRRVELPLALPSILSGVRVATVTAVGIATIGGLVGAGGLGRLIIDGIRRDFLTPIVVGMVLTTGLAIALDLLLVGIERLAQPWRRAVR